MENTGDDRFYEYETKCRKCGKLSQNFFGQVKNTSKADFKHWISEHSTFPLQKQCSCDNGSMMLHDIVGFGNVLDVL